MKPTLTISKTYELNILSKDIPIYVIVKKNIDFLLKMLNKYSKKRNYIFQLILNLIMLIIKELLLYGKWILIMRLFLFLIQMI